MPRDEARKPHRQDPERQPTAGDEGGTKEWRVGDIAEVAVNTSLACNRFRDPCAFSQASGSFCCVPLRNEAWDP